MPHRLRAVGIVLMLSSGVVMAVASVWASTTSGPATSGELLVVAFLAFLTAAVWCARE